MKYTTISLDEKEAYYGKFDVSKFSMSDARSDPSIFSYFMLGIKPYDYQDIFMNARAKRVAICSSRQIGKSLSVSIRALHEAVMKKNRKVIIVNPSLEQSYKLLQGIKDLMYQGDLHMKKLGKIKFFSGLIDKDRPNNSTQLSFTTGSFIRSVPATNSARGNTADLVLVDEAAFMDDKIFEEIILPMVTHTHGQIILSSTPNGPKGFFYKYFDPEDKILDNPYSRYWFQWTINDDPMIKNTVLEAKKTMDPISFEQEYDAKFTSSKTGFFSPEKVDDCVRGSEKFEYHKGACYVGIDWGLKDCKTVISVITFEGGECKLLHLKEFPVGFENHQIFPYLDQVMRDYNVVEIVSDDGSVSYTMNQMLEEKGYPIRKFDFNKEKVPAYMEFREWVEKGKVVFPRFSVLVDQMKALTYERTLNGHIKICKPQGGYDDQIDSLICAFSSVILEEEMVGLLLV